VDKGLVVSLFRYIHTVKGSASFLSLKKIAELSYAMELVIERMRSGDLKPTKEISSSLSRGVDRLYVLLDNISDESVPIDARRCPLSSRSSQENVCGAYGEISRQP